MIRQKENREWVDKRNRIKNELVDVLINNKVKTAEAVEIVSYFASIVFTNAAKEPQDVTKIIAAFVLSTMQMTIDEKHAKTGLE